MPTPPELSKRERQILDILYAQTEATAAQIHQQLPNAPMPGALRTLLRILEQKGHITHRAHGRQFIYRPTQPRSAAGRSALGRVLDVFFNGSIEQAVAAHLSDPKTNQLSADELRRLSNVIESARKKGL